MGRARMYDRRKEIEVRKSAVRAMQEKKHKEIKDKNITTSEIICLKCGFKARYQFVRCPECNHVQS
jgi:lipopolysaccharide biosynthesis regulator YciM